MVPVTSPDDDASVVDVPRAQSGHSPQHLLATVLGEYLDSADAMLPSAAVIAVLGEFGITPASARAALARLARRGLLAARGSGRATAYHLTAQSIARHRSTMHRFLAFGAEPRRWDGTWVAAAFSLPQVEQARRHAVRKTLASLGFVLFYDTVWISPTADGAAAREALDGLLQDVAGARWSIMRVQFEEEATPHGPVSAYDLAGLAAAYRAFIDEYTPLREEIRAGKVDAPRALVARTTLMDAWRRFCQLDPDLPPELLPTSWPRDEARDLFLEVHTALGPLAQHRLVEVLTPSWPGAAVWVTYFTAADDASIPPLRGRNVSDRGQQA